MARLSQTALLVAIVYFCCAEAAIVEFQKCGFKGFTCKNSKEFSKKVDMVFQCNTNLTGQNVTISLWQFNAPSNITSFTIQNCETVLLSFACTYGEKQIKWLKVANVQNLEIIPAQANQSPPQVIMENITYVNTIPRHTFSQLHNGNKGNCHKPTDDLSGITFRNVSIGVIESEGFWNLTDMKNFSWIGVSVYRMDTNAIELTFLGDIVATIHDCDINIMEPLAFRIIADAFYVTHTHFGNIWGSGFNGTIYTFVFNNNTVANIQAGAISILAKNVYMIENHFNIVESGAFQKIGPGLLRDSKMNFAKLRFVYMFNKNYLETVVNGGVEPDMVSYKNVASDVTYAYNIMQVFMRTPTHENQQRTNVIWN